MIRAPKPLRVAALIGCIVAVLALAGFWAPLFAAPADLESYKLVRVIDLPGTEGGIGGAMEYDADTRTIWLAQSPDRNLVVIATRDNSVSRVIDGVERPRGIAFDRRYGYVADPGAGAESGKVVVIDKHSLVPVATLSRVGRRPEAVYAGVANDTIWVLSADGLGVFEVAGKFAFKRVATYYGGGTNPKGEPEVGLYVPKTRRIYQPVASGIDVIDPALRQIEFHIELDRVGRMSATAYDARWGHLIVGTDQHHVLFVKAATGTLVGVVNVEGRVGEIAIDPALHRAYVADAKGTIDVIDFERYKLIATVPSEPGVHAIAVDPTTHAIYVYRSRANKVDVIAPK